VTGQQVVDDFVRGEIDRRGFVSKLTALGISASAPSAYALALGQQGATAAPESPIGGIARYQEDAVEEDYGSAFEFETDEEAVELVLGAIGNTRADLAGFEPVSKDNPDPSMGPDWARYFGDVEAVIIALEVYLTAHGETLAGLLGRNDGGSIAPAKFESTDAFLAGLGQNDDGSIVPTDFDSTEAFLAELVREYDNLTALYAAVVPAVRNGGIRQILMNAASVTNRQAALVNLMAGLDPIPEAFEVPEL
jgi:hypothetical protein